MKYKRIKCKSCDFIVDFEPTRFAKSDIRKESDDMADLFDEFVKVTVNEKPRVMDSIGFDWYKAIITGEIKSNIAPFKLYGAFWTDNGLQYVAEYTKEGEWELL